MVTITTFKWVPSFAQGYVKDHRIRWACEEAQIPYELRLVDQAETASDAYRKLQPFGQVPVLQDEAIVLFETGAILLYLGEKSSALMPKDDIGKGRATAWLFAALNSVEPFVQKYNTAMQDLAAEPLLKKQADAALVILEKRLASLNTWLHGKDYLENRFSISDIMMTTVLRNLDDKQLLTKFPHLLNYYERCEKRPAFQKAIAGQMKTFTENAPK